MNTKTSRFLAALLDNHTIKGFQCAAGDFLGAQTSIAGHIRAIWPPLLVGSSRLAVKVERALPGICRPPVRPKAKRLLRTSQDNTAAGRCITLDRRTSHTHTHAHAHTRTHTRKHSTHISDPEKKTRLELFWSIYFLAIRTQLDVSFRLH